MSIVKNLIWPTRISTYVRVGETVFRRDFISGDGRTQLRLVGELRRGRGRVGVAPRVAGMVDGGVDRVDVDAARNRIWRRCRKNVQLSVGDVIVMLLSRKPHQKFEIFVPPVEVDGQEVVGGDAGYGLVLVLGAAAASAGSLAQFATRVLTVPGFKSQMILIKANS